MVIKGSETTTGHNNGELKNGLHKAGNNKETLIRHIRVSDPTSNKESK